MRVFNKIRDFGNFNREDWMKVAQDLISARNWRRKVKKHEGAELGRATDEPSRAPVFDLHSPSSSTCHVSLAVAAGYPPQREIGENQDGARGSISLFFS